MSLWWHHACQGVEWGGGGGLYSGGLTHLISELPLQFQGCLVWWHHACQGVEWGGGGGGGGLYSGGLTHLISELPLQFQGCLVWWYHACQGVEWEGGGGLYSGGLTHLISELPLQFQGCLVRLLSRGEEGELRSQGLDRVCDHVVYFQGEWLTLAEQIALWEEKLEGGEMTASQS